MSNLRKISNLNVQRIITNRVKLSKDSSFQRRLSDRSYRGPASETELNQTIKHYDELAAKYLAVSDLLSLGLHRIWRQALVNNVEICKDTKILDAAAGTGLNTLRVLEKAKRSKLDSDFKITMCDMNANMMNIGQNTFKRLGYNTNLVEYVVGDLHKLPFEDGTFNTAMISWANRIYVDFNVVLKEMHRVLKPQGKIVLFDGCYSQNPTILQQLQIGYVEHIASRIEKMIFGNLGTAEFVVRSFREVVVNSNVEQMLKNANFQNIQIKPITLGLAEVTTAYKL